MLWRRRRFNDFSAEVQAHIELETDRLRAQGMSEAEARAAAVREFGNVAASEERFYESGTLSTAAESGLRDLRYGARVLRKSPAFLLVAVLSLALGIGANTAIFQLVDAVRLRTLPVKNPGELMQVRLADISKMRGSRNGDDTLSYPLLEQIRGRQQAFSSMISWANSSFDLAAGSEPRFVPGLFVSGDLFRTLGVEPVLGRLLNSADDRPGCGFPGVVISYPFWQQEFGGQASAVGRKLTVNNHPVEVLGVTPASFFGLEVGRTFDVALPVCSQGALQKADLMTTGTNWWLEAIGRLKPGWSFAQAKSHIEVLSPAAAAASLPANYPARSVKDYLALKLLAEPAGTGRSELREAYARPLWMLLAIAGLVLLIACANLANLMLARASAGQREITIRLAIGASRRQLVRQLMAESLLVAAAGAGLAILVARVLSRLLVALLSTEGNDIFVDLKQDWRVLGFTAALAILTSILFGLAPALRSTRGEMGDVLKGAGRGAVGDREGFGVRRLLVVCQIALSLVLVVGALLFAGTFKNLVTADAGFRQEGVLVARVGFGRLALPRERLVPFRQELLDRLRAVPGVDAASDTDTVPLGGSFTGNSVWMDGSDVNHGGNSLRARIGGGYFETMRTPLLAGRGFDDRDTATSQKVAMVNEAFARKLVKGENPVGQRFWVEQTPNEPSTQYEIVGMVRNTKYYDLREGFEPIVFQPMTQDPAPNAADTFVIHTNMPIDSLIPAVRQTLTAVNPSIRYQFRVFQTSVRDTLVQERLMASLSTAFGILAGLLAAIGLYGVMTYLVARRRNEIGIRMALGANRLEIMRMVLRESGLLLGIGLVVGTLLSLAAGRAVTALLWGVKAYDPTTLAMAGGVLAVIALAASSLPARRAATLDPMAALRDE
jgi:putative ABC transport system permease protein